jgi:hypothetical protein
VQLESEGKTHRVTACGVSVGQVETFVLSDPFDLPAVSLEELVRVAGSAIPDLEFDAVGGRAVGNVEAFTVERLQRASERRNGDAPGDVAIGEGSVEIRVETRDEGDLCAVGV